MYRVIKLYNKFHLGDNVFSFILFYNIKEYIENNNIIIFYYCNKEYIQYLLEFKCSDNIIILENNDYNGLNIHIGNENLKLNWYNYNEITKNFEDLKVNIINKRHYEIFYISFFNNLLEELNIPIIFEKLEYDDPELLNRYNNINQIYDNKYSNIDILILNSIARSGQYEINDNEWNELINNLNKKYKIITTEKVEGINCTRDDNLTIKDIAAISINSKKIIAVNSGVVPGLFNKYTLNNVEAVYIFDNNVCYQNSKFKDVCNIHELNFLLEDNN